MAITFLGAKEIKGNTVTVQVQGASLGEMVVFTSESEPKQRQGQIIALEGDTAIAQVFEGTEGFTLTNTSARLMGHPLQIALSEEILGRTFDGLGRPIDGLGPVSGNTFRDINSSPINPLSRVYPRDFIQTGISAIDLLLTLVRGQKLPIFSVQGLNHNKLAVQLVSQTASDNTYLVFAGIGLKFDTYKFFQDAFREMGNSDRLVTFLNLADSPVAERLTIPKTALTAAEYLAFDLGYNVLVIITDMTAYCEALRELSANMGEIPGRKGFPGYMYSNLSAIYERAGIIQNRKGSVTLVPILTMPAGDITHPIPDLTGFITEGQIVLDPSLGVYPPINVLPSLSRLMKDGIGQGRTTADHPKIASDIFAAYAKVGHARDLAQIIGEDELSPEDKLYIKFGHAFENEFLQQLPTENRSIQQTMTIAKNILKIPEQTNEQN